MNDVVTIYRYQSAAGRGPFQPSLTNAWKDPEADILQPIDVGIVKEAVKLGSENYGLGAFGFGCLSIDDLKRWFNSLERINLSNLGFHPYKIVACRPMIMGHWEVFFGRRWKLSDGERIVL